MQRIFFPSESLPQETRISVVPETVEKYVRLGAEVRIATQFGQHLGYADSAYKEVGAIVVNDLAQGLDGADIVMCLRPPSQELIEKLHKNQVLVSHLDPFTQNQRIRNLQQAGVSSIAMELIPRSTIAQKMDALSSQANLGGYVAVLLATQYLPQVLPMMMTPAGTIKPARFFIVGVGVAGLQAIATAKRLGARVDAFDTRPVVEEQVRSLGAKFFKIDLGETGQTKDGYAKALSEEQLERQRQAMAKQCAVSDVVITAAQVFGRKAPVIITPSMLDAMRPGSVVVDTAIDTGGNVEGSVADDVIDRSGVKIVAFRNLPGRVPRDASQMYSSNLFNFINHFWDKEDKVFRLNRDDEIIQSALVTHEGEIVNERIQSTMASS